MEKFSRKLHESCPTVLLTRVIWVIYYLIYIEVYIYNWTDIPPSTDDNLRWSNPLCKPSVYLVIVMYKRFSIFKAWKSMPKVHIIHVDIKIDFADSKLIAAACYWSTPGQSRYDRFAALFRGVVSRHNILSCISCWITDCIVACCWNWLYVKMSEFQFSKIFCHFYTFLIFFLTFLNFLGRFSGIITNFLSIVWHFCTLTKSFFDIFTHF